MSPARRSGGTICTRPEPPDNQPTPTAGPGWRLPGPPAARVRGLRKVYRRTVALDSVDLDVPAGAVLGLLGPNGSGKTTMLRLLLGLARPSGGTVELLGQPMPRSAGCVLPHVGALVEEPGFLPHLSGRDNLARCAAAEPLLATAAIPNAVDTALRRVGLARATGADRPYRTYSLGMKQRLGLAAVLLAPRKLVVLDEPTNGLDPAGTREVRRLIAELHAAGATVLLSSHLLSEVEETCTHVAVLTTGSVVATGELAELLEADGPALQIHTSQPNAALAALRAARIPGYTERGLVVADLSDTPPELVLSTLVHAGVPVAEARRRRTGLEELFVQLTEDGA
ncbi:MAG TPA: ABC transporter ATP-binding protein [Pseudonocardia sp.]|nr:ABC transporter ATP-binding protein [Pseudonocardia sp.]